MNRKIVLIIIMVLLSGCSNKNGVINEKKDMNSEKNKTTIENKNKKLTPMRNHWKK